MGLISKIRNTFKKDVVMTDIPDCIKPNGKTHLKVMTIADSHGHLEQGTVKSVLSGALPDAVFFLGDNFPCDIETALEELPLSVTQIYGLTGNHDAKDSLVPYSERITEIDKATGTVLSNGCRLEGLSGSIRYKEDDYYSMLTNEESERIMAEKPQCDILITHDKPCFYVPKTVDAHSGLLGIGKYILEKKPQIVLHGHLHKPYIKQLGDTIIRCCYGVEMFDITLQ